MTECLCDEACLCVSIARLPRGRASVYLIVRERRNVPAVDHDDLVPLAEAGDAGVGGGSTRYPGHYYRDTLDTQTDIIAFVVPTPPMG